MNEVAHDLRSNWFPRDVDRVSEIADQFARSHGIARNICLMDKAADQLALGDNWLTGGLDRVNEIADEMTEILHLKDPFRNLQVPQYMYGCIARQTLRSDAGRSDGVQRWL